MAIPYMGTDFIRQLVGAGLQFGQQLVSQTQSPPSTVSEMNDEDTWTTEKLIKVADHYRHRQDNERAESYYCKALDKMTEIESKSVWNVYRKMIRMGNNSDRCRDYFIQQYSKYDDSNPNHLSMIATLQIILYKLSLSQNEYEAAFNCLISSALMAVKLFVYQINIDSQCLSGLLDRLFHHDSIANAADILTKLMEIYSTGWTTHLQQFISEYVIADDLASIIHHATVDRIIDEIKLKYDNNPSAKRIFRFLDTLLQSLRQSIITSTEKSTLSFRDQVLKFLGNYNDEKSSWFYFIKTLESLCIGNTTSFFNNADRFRFETVNFERYQELKEKLSLIFAKFEENQLYSYLETIAKTL